MHLTTKLNTVFLLVGPSMSGKTTFAKQLIQRLHRAGQARHLNLTISHLSSDENRRALLQNTDVDRHSAAMLEVSAQAFQMLFTELDVVTSYPVNHDFIVVDTTGLNEKFRDDVRNMAKARGYNVELVVFEYNKAEALKGIPEETHPLILGQLSRMKRDVLPNLKAREYTKRTKISQRSEQWWNDLVVEIENLRELDGCLYHLAQNEGLAVIGDSHEHVEALTELLAKLDAIDPKLVKVHIGDYLDKGGNTEAMLKLMQHRSYEHGDIIIQGNHEAYVVRRLRGEIEPNLEIEERYITSLSVLKDRPDLKEILFDLWDNRTVPFLKVTSDMARTLYVTHAPCDEVHLGKLSPFAIRAQRNLYSKDRTQDYRLEYGFIFEQASAIRPLHVFGHVAHKAEQLNYKNKIFLDTGAVYGHKLTAMVYRNDRYDFVSVDAKSLDTTDKQLPNNATSPIKVERPFNIRDYDLDADEMRFVNGFVKRGAKFISGTMAPAPSTQTELEGLYAALDYYRKRGVNEVVLEPKYMGSRCQLYLFKGDLERCFAVSRNGYSISAERVPRLPSVLRHWLNWFEVNCPDDSEIVLDGELLPWSALGKGLIEDNFRSYGHLVGYELDQLTDPVLAGLEFPTKPDVSARKQDLADFFRTLSLYDKDIGDDQDQVPLEFKAFSILSLNGVGVAAQDRDEAFVFNLINRDGCVTVHLDSEEDVRLAHAFFNDLTVEQGMEGVVVKPRFPAVDVVPYMKVRNPEYLRLVYGYDYLSERRYSPLLRQKNITHKAKVSLKEWELGKQMLEARTEDQLKEAVVKMVGQLKVEKTLDPRL
jgi:predicted kinase